MKAKIDYGRAFYRPDIIREVPLNLKPHNIKFIRGKSNTLRFKLLRFPRKEFIAYFQKKRKGEEIQNLRGELFFIARVDSGCNVMLDISYESVKRIPKTDKRVVTAYTERFHVLIGNKATAKERREVLEFLDPYLDQIHRSYRDLILRLKYPQTLEEVTGKLTEAQVPQAIRLLYDSFIA